MTQHTSNPWAWGGLQNTASSLLADINTAAQISGRTFLGNWLQREFNGSLYADPLSVNADGAVTNQNVSQSQEAANYMGTGLSQANVMVLGAAAIGIIAIAVLRR